MTDPTLEERLHDWFHPLHDEVAPPAVHAFVTSIADGRPVTRWQDRFRVRPLVVFAALALSASVAISGLVVLGGSPGPAPVTVSPAPVTVSPAPATVSPAPATPEHATPAPSPSASGLAGNGLIAYSSNGRIFLIRGDGTGRKALPGEGTFEYTPKWSPDGTKIAFLSQYCVAATGCPDKLTLTSLVVMNADGSGRRTLAGDFENPLAMAWSPDSTRIVFDPFSPGAQGPRIVMVSLDGSAPRTLADGQFATWSPDGTAIAYEGDGINLVAPDGSGKRVLVPATDFVRPGGPAIWSPDGSRLAYAATQVCCPQAATGTRMVDPLSGESHVIPQLPGTAQFLGWSPDGRSITYIYKGPKGNRPGGRVLAVADADGSNELFLSELGRFVGWSPDGTRLLETANSDAPSDFGAQNELIIADPTGATKALVVRADHLSGASWQPVP